MWKKLGLKSKFYLVFKELSYKKPLLDSAQILAHSKKQICLDILSAINTKGYGRLLPLPCLL